MPDCIEEIVNLRAGGHLGVVRLNGHHENYAKCRRTPPRAFRAIGIEAPSPRKMFSSLRGAPK